VGKNKYFRAA
jgi:hypothetical protein